MTAFLDTNVVVYAASGRASAPAKYERATAILRDQNYATSAQIHAEFYSVVTGKNRPPMAHAEAMIWLYDLRTFPVVPLTADLVARGADLAEQYRISYWDGAILAAAAEAGASTLFTEDLSHAQLYGPVRVVNPFL